MAGTWSPGLGPTAGDDVFAGDEFDDLAYGGAGNDTMSGNDGNDILHGEDGSDTLHGGAGNDTLVGGEGHDTLEGGDGDDVINGGPGADVIHGGDGIDTLDYSTSSHSVTISLGGPGNQVLSSGDAEGDSYTSIEIFVGSSYNDVISDYIRENTDTVTLRGGDGADWIYAWTGNSILEGGDGDDILYGYTGLSQYYGGEGTDTVSYQNWEAGVTLRVGDIAPHAGLDSGRVYSSIERILGGSGSDSITIVSGAYFVDGRLGDDTITGGTGEDYFIGDSGDDILNGMGGNDTLLGGIGDDILYGSDGDYIDAGEGDDFIYLSGAVSVYGVVEGGLGSDTLDITSSWDMSEILFSGLELLQTHDFEVIGTAEQFEAFDTIWSSADSPASRVRLTLASAGSVDLADELLGRYVDFKGSSGNDVITSSNGSDILDGAAGDDVLNGGLGNDSLTGGLGNDTLDGGDGDDTLNGSGDDTLLGGLGNDRLYGAGNDDINGGDGDDTVYLSSLVSGAGSIEGGAGNDTLNISSSSNISGHTFTSLEILQTNNVEVIATAEQFEAFDTIWSEAGRPSSRVRLTLASEGSVDLADELLGRWVLFNGSSGDDVVTSSNGNDSLNGAEGEDVLNSGLGNDTLNGGLGNDTLEGGAGSDTLDGGDGVDTARYAASAAAVTVRLNGGAITGGDATGDTLVSIENIIGSAYKDTLIGSSDANRIEGGGGNDYLDGLEGDDTLTGGAGADRIFGKEGADLLEGGAGADALDGGNGADTASYVGSSAAVTVRLNAGDGVGGDAQGDTLTSIENLIGSDHADTLVGANGAVNRLEGGLGNDTLFGLGGADVLLGGDGDDRLDGGTAADTLDGGAGVDTASYAQSGSAVTVRLNGGANTGGDATGDTLLSIENAIGSAYKDTLIGSTADNRLDGGGGNDFLDGQAGNDTLIGGSGDDRVSGGLGADTLDGGGGSDTANYHTSSAGVTVRLNAGTGTGGDAEGDLYTSIENVLGSTFEDILVGANGISNRLEGGAGNDILHGLGGHDTLAGGDSDDYLFGGLGNDYLDGGAGADVLVFDTALGANNVDQISGFSAADDIIRLENAVFTGLATGALAGSAFTIGAAATTAAHRIIYNSTTGQLFFDADGSGAGAAILFATLDTGLGLTEADFLVV